VNILTISITTLCNRKCYYCPIAKWRLEKEDTSINKITNDALIKWLKEFINPNEWFLEITGGEPGLYREIKTLIPELSKSRYRGIVKTNGSLPIPKTKNFPLVTAWHKDVEEIPKWYDTILIIKNPDDNWRRKVKYCILNGIPYKTVLFDEWYKTKTPYNKDFLPYHGTSQCLHINNRGLITPCSKVTPTEGNDIFNMYKPQPLNVMKECPKCKNILDAEMFMPERNMQGKTLKSIITNTI